MYIICKVLLHITLYNILLSLLTSMIIQCGYPGRVRFFAHCGPAPFFFGKAFMKQVDIIEEFLELVQLEVYPFKERLMADALKPRLEELGCLVAEDDTGSKINGDAGSLIARLPGDPSRPPVMFAAHMDRVENHGRIRPVIEGDLIKSDGSSILAADDVSGICAILDGLRRVKAEGSAHGEIEIVMTVGEETGFYGARYLDYTQIKSKNCFVLDAAGPVGLINNECPAYYNISIKVHGRASHAGACPEEGLSAIVVAARLLTGVPSGRLSPLSTSNFGVIKGGAAVNIVPDYCEIEAEARTRRPEEMEEYIARFKETAARIEAETGGRIELDFDLHCPAFKVEEHEEVIQIALAACGELGIEPRLFSSGGNNDCNIFNQHGLKSVGISPGMEKAHTNEEEISIARLRQAGELVAELIRQAGRPR